MDNMNWRSKKVTQISEKEKEKKKNPICVHVSTISQSFWNHGQAHSYFFVCGSVVMLHLRAEQAKN